MSGTLQVRDHLLNELETGVRTGEDLIRKIRPEDWSFRPQDKLSFDIDRGMKFVCSTYRRREVKRKVFGYGDSRIR